MTKQFFVGVGITAILAAGIIIWLLRKQNAQINSYHDLITQGQDSTTHFKNKAGQLVAENIQIQTSLKALQDVRPLELEKLRRDFNIQLKDIRNYLIAKVEVKDSGTSKIINIPIDSSGGKSTVKPVDNGPQFVIDDHYLHLSGRVYPEEVVWKYHYYDTLTFLGKVKKKWFLGKETYFVNGKMQNPLAKITTINSVEIKEFKDKRFGIGPSLIWSPLTPQKVVIGFGIHYDLIKF